MADFNISTFLAAFGLTSEIGTTVALAVADPTSERLQDVVEAYAKNGQVAPTKLMAYLIQINEERHPEDTYRGASFPWLFAGAAVMAYFIFGKKRRGRRR